MSDTVAPVSEDDKPKRGRKPAAEKSEEVKPIAIEIVCDSAKKDAAAEVAFMERMDEKGGVLAFNPVCGGSMYFKDMDHFPKTNKRCTCGKPGHYAVKYTFK